MCAENKERQDITSITRNDNVKADESDIVVDYILGEWRERFGTCHACDCAVALVRAWKYVIGYRWADRIEDALRIVRPPGEVRCFVGVTIPLFRSDTIADGTIELVRCHINLTSVGFASLTAVLRLLGSMRCILGDELVDQLSVGIGKLMQDFVPDQKGGDQ